MHLQVAEEMIVNASAEDVWRVLAHDFDQIHLWSSGIQDSYATDHITAVASAPVSGRVCRSDGLGGDATEAFTYYDEAEMRFGYQAIGDMPKFIQQVENNWMVKSVTPDSAMVGFRAEIDMNVFPGVLLLPLVPIMRRVWGRQTLEEFKHFVEMGQPHPRKIKAMQKSRS